ncbi:unnamed protein product [Blepharisma stoltei]|uniref:Uncharacterized protein n=1 Tax=Blepharisma stoltei TaxID=1481888 RepID=A0AAU9J7R7_9CILI|nr:unnamed protein product [Blepharisma stoltei]
MSELSATIKNKENLNKTLPVDESFIKYTSYYTDDFVNPNYKDIQLNKFALSLKDATDSIEAQLPRKIETFPMTLLSFKCLSRSSMFLVLVYRGQSGLISYNSITSDTSNPVKISEDRLTVLETCKDDTVAAVGVGIYEHRIFLYKIYPIELLRILSNHHFRVSYFVVSYDKQFLYSIAKNEIFCWNSDNFEKPSDSILLDEFDKIDVSIDGRVLILGSKTGKIVKYTFDGGNVSEIKYEKGIKIIKISYFGNFIAVSYKDYVKILTLSNLSFIYEVSIKSKIKSLAFTKKNGSLVIGTIDGQISIWEFLARTDLINIPISLSQISKLDVDDNDQIFILCKKNDFFALNYPSYSSMALFSDYSGMAFNADTLYFYDQTNRIFINKVGTQEKSVLITHPRKIEKLVPANNILIILDFEYITAYNQHTCETFEKKKGRETSFAAEVSSDFSWICVGGLDQKLRIYSLDTLELIKEFVGHTNEIRAVCIFRQDTLIATGSRDSTSKIWNFKSGENLVTLKGHQRPIYSVKSVHDDKLLLTASFDHTIKIWFWETGSLVHTIIDKGGIYSIAVSPNNGYFVYGGTSEELNFFCTKTFSKILSIKGEGVISMIKFSSDGKYIICKSSWDSKVYSYVIENPMNKETCEVYGFGVNKYKFMKYIQGIIKWKDPKAYDSSMDDCVMLPDMITPLQIYTFFNMTECISKSLENRPNFASTSFNLDPISIAVKKNLKDSLSILLQHLMLCENPFVFSLVSKEILIGINSADYPIIQQFYATVFKKAENLNLPMQCSKTVWNPIFFHSDIFVPKSIDFFGNDKIIEEKTISFWYTLLPLNLTLGSQDSIDFLQSILCTPNKSIFRTQFIKMILLDKWLKAKWIMYVQACIYILYMTCLSLYVLFDRNGMSGIIPFFILSIVLFVYEVLQMVYNMGKRSLNLWVCSDIVRSGLAFLYCIYVWKNDDNSKSDEILVYLMCLSWLRGLSYFRLFIWTRYMINLLFEVLKDMISFLLILFYSVLSFCFIFIAIDSSSDHSNFAHYIEFSYLVILNSFDSSTFSSLEWVIFIIASIIEPIILLNVLISIMGNTYERVQEGFEVADNYELTDMILEVENLLLWNRRKRNYQYFQMCMDNLNDDDSDSWMGKIKELKMMINTIQKGQETISEENKLFLTEIKAIKADSQALRNQISGIEANVLTLLNHFQKNEENKKNLSRYFCPKMHDLVEDDDYANEIYEKYNKEPYCNRCLKKKNGVYYVCKTCEYLICENCLKFMVSPTEKATWFTCTLSHKLIFIEDLSVYQISETAKKTLICESCKKLRLTGMITCETCKIYLCLKCIERIKKFIPILSTKFCRNGHQLEWREKITYRNPSYCCDICRASVRRIGSFHCDLCVFDVCPKCIENI